MAATAALPESAVAENKRIGNSYEFEMEGNPSTGYKWKLNAQASTGLDVVKVEALGYGKAKSRKVGAPAIFIFRITCIGSGFARLQFDYVSPGSNRKVARSHTHDLRCE
jgi:predicted secreted protein